MRTMPNSRHKFSRAAIFDTAYEVRRRGADASRRVQSRSRQRRRGVTPAGGSSTTFVSNANYEPFGPLQSFGYGNGLNLTRAYDADYRLTGITLAPATGAALLNLGFSWQTDGRLSGVTDSAGTGRADSYTYTNSGRVLTGVASGLWGSDTYAYDANGNLTQTGATASPVSITVATSSNRITKTKLAGATQRTFTYRTGGDLSIDNPAGSSAFNYTYNAARRLSGVSKGSTAKGAYGYDFAGRRVWRQTFGSGAAQTAYVFDTDGHVLAEENAVSGAMTKEYVWLDDALVGMFVVQSGGTVARYVTTGQIDEPLVTTQPNKNVAWSGYTDPYGNQGTLSGSASLLDLRLPGQWYEAEGNASGLHQNGYRDYDPSLGRYIEADPLGVDAGANLYGYVNGDPLNLIDPEGLFPIPGTNWCGPNWASGQCIPESGPLPRPGQPGYNGPRSPADSCCQKHDYCISACPHPIKGSCVRACDTGLSQCAGNIPLQQQTPFSNSLQSLFHSGGPIQSYIHTGP